MQTKNLALAAAFVALAAAAAYPHIEAYRKSLPIQLTKEQAGQRYLAAVCPINKILDQSDMIEKKVKEETSKYYYPGSEELYRANARIGALRNNTVSLGYRFLDASVKSAKILTDPHYIWPENVRAEVQKMAEEQYEDAAYTREALKGTKVKEPVDTDTASKIRVRLGLGVRGGCV